MSIESSFDRLNKLASRRSEVFLFEYKSSYKEEEEKDSINDGHM